MTKPVRMQRKRTKGWRMQAASRAINGLPAKYVGRPSKWGNPFKTGDAEADVAWYRFWIEQPGHARGMLYDKLFMLRGHNLVCWCPLLDKEGNPYPCHADLLLDLANKKDP